jgi:hypothetical protein
MRLALKRETLGVSCVGGYVCLVRSMRLVCKAVLIIESHLYINNSHDVEDASSLKVETTSTKKSPPS